MRNRVQLIGNLGQDPKVIELESGKKLVRFPMATNESYKNSKGEKVTSTEWHNIVAWGNLADIAGQYLSKGKEIALEGRLQNTSYEDKEGKTRYVTEIIAQDFVMLGSKS